MPGVPNWDWALDGWIVAAGALCALAASLLGNFLVLRKLSMLGDAISHAVLPGLAAAFLIGGSREGWPMFLGAAVVGVLTALATEWIRGYGQVDEGASMGVVFTSLFALGLVVIVQAADQVDLDPGCVLYGAIESAPQDMWRIGSFQAPRVVMVLGVVLLIDLSFVVVFYKELKLTSFDPALADTMGIRSRWMHYLLMSLVAVTAVASFECVGNILVVAMFVTPAATASLLTDRFPRMMIWTAVLAVLSAALGHWSALVAPAWFGYASTTTTGMMAVVAGLLFTLAVILAPERGVLIRGARQLLLGWNILGDDILALLFRREERAGSGVATRGEFREALLARPVSLSIVLGWYRLARLLLREGASYRLTDDGRNRAQALVRSHRLWEQYLVGRAGLPGDRIHGQAERLEHYTSRDFREELERETEFPALDPHGRPIPKEK